MSSGETHGTRDLNHWTHKIELERTKQEELKIVRLKQVERNETLAIERQYAENLHGVIQALVSSRPGTMSSGTHGPHSEQVLCEGCAPGTPGGAQELNSMLPFESARITQGQHGHVVASCLEHTSVSPKTDVESTVDGRDIPNDKLAMQLSFNELHQLLEDTPVKDPTPTHISRAAAHESPSLESNGTHYETQQPMQQNEIAPQNLMQQRHMHIVQMLVQMRNQEVQMQYPQQQQTQVVQVKHSQQPAQHEMQHQHQDPLQSNQKRKFRVRDSFRKEDGKWITRTVGYYDTTEDAKRVQDEIRKHKRASTFKDCSNKLMKASRTRA